MPHPFSPEPIPALQARYPLAIAETHDVESIRLGVAMPPSALARCRFDTQGGVRLIISRERSMCGEVGLHISASLEPGTPFFRRLQALPPDAAGMFRRFMTEAERLFRLISDDKRTPEHLFTTPELIPHWWIWEPKTEKVEAP